MSLSEENIVFVLSDHHKSLYRNSYILNRNSSKLYMFACDKYFEEVIAPFHLEFPIETLVPATILHFKWEFLHNWLIIII